MPFKGTDRDAWEYGSKGKTPEERSKRYHYYLKNKSKLQKRENKELDIIKRLRKNNKSRFKDYTRNKPISKKEKRPRKVVKNIIVEDVKEHIKSQIISSVSSMITENIMKEAEKHLTDKQKENLIKCVEFVSSEVFKKTLEKPLKVINDVKMFIKIGKYVYKVIVKFNEISNKYDFVIGKREKMPSLSIEYRNFLKKYPNIKNEYYSSYGRKKKFKYRCPKCRGKLYVINENETEYLICENYNKDCDFKSEKSKFY